MNPKSETTCWTLIDKAAHGDEVMRNEFSLKYYSVVRNYLSARWKKSNLASSIDDACQEVFVECLRTEGPLHRAERGRSGGFRAFLFGIVRNVARRTEQLRERRPLPGDVELQHIDADETSLSKVFDRVWAVAIMKEAGERQAMRAASIGDDAIKRVELLKLRFRDGLPIRAIAKQWGVETVRLHREYSKARKEFLCSLREVVWEQNDGVNSREVDQRCLELIEMLK